MTDPESSPIQEDVTDQIVIEPNPADQNEQKPNESTDNNLIHEKTIQQSKKKCSAKENAEVLQKSTAKEDPVTSLLQTEAAIAAIEALLRNGQKPVMKYPKDSDDSLTSLESPIDSKVWTTIVPKPCKSGRVRKCPKKRLPAEQVDVDLMREMRKLNDCTATLEVSETESTGSVQQSGTTPATRRRRASDGQKPFYWF